MLTYLEALTKILEMPFRRRIERISLLDGGGRVLSATVQAAGPSPRFDQSAMDGIAVRSADTFAAADASPSRLRIVGESAAGRPYVGVIGAAECVRINTGAAMPLTADAVVPIERVTVRDGYAEVTRKALPRDYVRVRGQDVREGGPLLERGTRLDPAALAFLSAFNIPSVDVFARPRVAVFTSGDELRAYGERLEDTSVVASSLYYLERELTACGCQPRIFGISPDDRDRWRDMFLAAHAWGDIVLTTAGVSVGEHDVVQSVVKEIGGDVLFWRVGVRPGKPMLCALVGGKPFFGLPGNAVSTCCNVEIFLKPFLRQAFNIHPFRLPTHSAMLANECPRDRERLFFVYAIESVEENRWMARPLPNQSSSNLGNPARANSLIVLEPGETSAPRGELVPVIPVRVGL